MQAKTIGRAAVLLGILVALPPGAARAQSIATCDPTCARGAACACAFGHDCVEGACVPRCDPACPDGQLCSAPGECSADPAAAQVAPAAPVAAAPASEETAAACSNGADDDGDALVDCAEPSCGLFVFCQGRAQAPAAVTPGVVALPAGTRGASPAPIDELSAERNPVFAMHVNLGGVATFGPSLSLEFGGVVTFQLLARAGNGGALNYVLQEEHSGWADDLYVFGIGAGAALRVYLSRGMRGMRGFWIGAATEYQLSLWRRVGTYDEEMHAIVPSFQIGWRWIWRGFLLGLGASAGYLAQVGSNVTYAEDVCDSCRERLGDASGAFYLLHVEIGFAI